MEPVKNSNSGALGTGPGRTICGPMSRRLLALLAIWASVGGGCKHPAPPSPDRTGEVELARLVDEQRMTARVHELVRLGPRMGGTRSGERAVELRTRVFRAMGLSVERVIGPERWCHEEDSFSVRAHIDGEAFTLEHAWPFGFSPSARGRARVVLEPEPDACLLTERSPTRRGRSEDLLVHLVDGHTTPDGTWPQARAIRRGHPHPVFGISRGEGARLREAVLAGGLVEVEFELESTIVESRSITVVATLAAREGAPPGYLLFCAHGDSDSGGPGANDNGSGEAIVEEIARVWALSVEEGRVPAPPREVRFAVWGTEIASTRDFLKNVAADGGPLLGVVNYDQSGFGSGAEQLNVEPDDLPANEAFVRLLVEVLTDHAGEPGFPPRWATNKSLGGTDSYVFSGSETFRTDSRPAVTIFTSAWDRAALHPRTPGMPGESWSDRDVVSVDYDNFYHSAGDLPENTTDREPWNMGWCARLGLLGAMRWLDAIDAAQSL